MPITFSKVLSVYALMQASFQSFKALHRVQQYSTLIEEHNRARRKDVSLEALDENRIFRALDEREIIPLLHFWAVFAVIHLYDSYFEIFLEWIPFYAMVKLALMVWILFPKTQGATVFFENVLIPQVDKQMLRMEEKWFPLARRIVLNLTFILFRAGLDANLETVSMGELNELNRSMDLITRTVTREGYKRNREESMQTLRAAVPEEKQRNALLDDILREYDDYASSWSEIRLEKEGSGKDVVRVRFASDFDEEEEEDWFEHMITPDDFL